MRFFFVFIFLILLCLTSSCGRGSFVNSGISLDTDSVYHDLEIYDGFDADDYEVILPDVPSGFSFERPNVALEMVLPLENGRVSSFFGMRENPVTGKNKFHAGYDIAARGGTTVRSMFDGTVKKCGRDVGYGNYIIIDHGNGIETLYAHLSEITISENNTILKGETIGKVGMTGAATGNHLHLELIINGCKYDPEWIICGAYG